MPELIQLSRNTYNSMPSYAVGLLAEALREKGGQLEDTEIAVLGVAYK